MIAAADALRLPAAQLTPEEKEAAAAILQGIEAHVQEHMSRGGIVEHFDTAEKRPQVMAEVNWRLKKRQWIPQWQQLMRKGQVSNNPIHVGWRLVSLGATDEAYEEADSLGISASA